MVFRLLFFVSFLLIFLPGFSQNVDDYQIGYYWDLNGKMIDGYYDFTTEFKRPLKIKTVVGDYYTPGSYYTIGNIKKAGLLKYRLTDSNVKFKENESARAKTIDPLDCRAYVIGPDSFAVIRNFSVPGVFGIATLITTDEFAEVIDQVGDFVFYKYNQVSTMGSPGGTFYIVRNIKTVETETFSDKKNKANDLWKSIFNKFDVKFTTLESAEEDIPSIIKRLKYALKYKNKEKIYFSDSWDEITDSSKSFYYAEVVSVKDTVLHLAYFFNNHTPIYEADFYSFYPHRKTGTLVWFYPNGRIRKKALYIKNVLQNTATYYPNGNLHYAFIMKRKKLYYNKVHAENGVKLIDSLGNGSEVFYDSISNISINYEFKKHRLMAAYYFNERNEKVFRFAKKSASFVDFYYFQNNLTELAPYPQKSLINKKHGFALLKCTVEANGNVTKFEIVKSVDAATDSLINQAVIKFKANKSWFAAKYQKTRVKQEIIIPIDFSIEAFSSYINNYYYNNNFMFQQQMMQNMKPPVMNVPRF